MTVTTEPLYATLADRLRRDILSGAIPRGGKLPSETALAEKHGIVRATVRRAIEELVAEGLVVSVSGRGHFVRESKPLIWRASDPERGPATDAVDGPADTWSRSVRAQGRVPAEEIRTEVVLGDEQVAHWLHLDPGEPVSVRRRTRYVDGEAYSTADSYYPRSIVGGTEIELPGDVRPGVFAVFERIGRPWVSHTDCVISRAPTRDESRLLSIPRGVAITEIVRRSFDADGVPVRLTRFVLPGDRHVIEYAHKECP